MKSATALALDAWHFLLHHLLRLAPIEVTSALGGALVRANVRFNRREIYENAMNNVRKHCAGIEDSAARAVVASYLDNVGRVMAEFSVIDRIAPRITFSNLGPARALYMKRPILAIILHTGNWEMFAPALTLQGLKVTTFYEPPESGVHRRIVEETRQRAGVDLLTPDFAGMRRAMGLLQQKKVVAIFGDEARNGVAMAPLFGRPPHTQGNLAIAAKLARRTNAILVVGYCERKPKCQFVLHISDPFELSSRPSNILNDVADLNDRIEPIIRKHLGSWYFLDDSLREIDPTNVRNLL